MISYAQNYEDVILERVFHDRAHGRYVDIGAHFPLIDSVTEHFYRKGWRGINVEPLPAAFAELCAARPHDINVNCAIGSADGNRRFFALDGLSTLLPELASDLRASAGTPREIEVGTLRLATLLQRHAIGHVDFLKIDVEGAEAEALGSNDWQRFRPAMVLAEAVHPVTHAATHLLWEDILLGAGYRFVHFDGVNRFYWNDDLPAPPARCFVPPNALDGFVPYTQIAAEARAAEAARVAQYESQRASGAEQAARHVVSGIAEALHRLAQGVEEPAPYPELDTAWRALAASPRSQSPELRTANAASQAPDTEAEAALRACQTKVDDLTNLLAISEHRRLSWLRNRRLVHGGTHEAPDPLVERTPLRLGERDRIVLAGRCRDADALPKVAGAGSITSEADGRRVQLMHNGIRLLADDHDGDCRTRLIEACRGHRKPQEERIFHEVVSRLPGDGTMIELGGHRAFHSIWFLRAGAGRRAALLEPDPAHIATGQANMALNQVHAQFIQGFVGDAPGTTQMFQTQHSGVLDLPCLDVAALLERSGFTHLTILQCDVQGAELAVLRQAAPLVRAGRIDWIFVSTHHHSFSGDPLTHQRCLEQLRELGGVIEAEYDVQESFSGDGFICARFCAAPAGWMPIRPSYNRSSESLFRHPLYDLAWQK